MLDPQPSSFAAKTMNRFIHQARQALIVLTTGAGLTFCAAAAEQVLQTETNVMVELTLTASRTHADPFNEVTLDVVFADPKGHELRVPAFWAGTNVWKARYA